MYKHYLRNLEFKVYEFLPRNDFRFYASSGVIIPTYKGGNMKDKKKEKHTFDYYHEMTKKAIKKTDWEKVLKNKYFLFRSSKKHTTIFNYAF